MMKAYAILALTASFFFTNAIATEVRCLTDRDCASGLFCEFHTCKSPKGCTPAGKHVDDPKGFCCPGTVGSIYTPFPCSDGGIDGDICGGIEAPCMLGYHCVTKNKEHVCEPCAQPYALKGKLDCCVPVGLAWSGLCTPKCQSTADCLNYLDLDPSRIFDRCIDGVCQPRKPTGECTDKGHLPSKDKPCCPPMSTDAGFECKVFEGNACTSATCKLNGIFTTCCADGICRQSCSKSIPSLAEQGFEL